MIHVVRIASCKLPGFGPLFSLVLWVDDAPMARLDNSGKGRPYIASNAGSWLVRIQIERTACIQIASHCLRKIAREQNVVVYDIIVRSRFFCLSSLRVPIEDIYVCSAH